MIAKSKEEQQKIYLTLLIKKKTMEEQIYKPQHFSKFNFYFHPVFFTFFSKIIYLHVLNERKLSI